MKQNDNSPNNNGISFLGALTIVFVVLKLIGVVDWSWWGVLAPLWIPIALFTMLVAIYIVLNIIKNL